MRSREEVSTDLATSLRELVATVMREENDENASADEQTERGLVLTEVIFGCLSYELGYVEGIAILAGASLEKIDKSRRQMLSEGKREVLRMHSEECDGCEGSEVLEGEVEIS